MRLHLFEFEDFEWLPAAIRDGGLDYLRYVQKTTPFLPFPPILPCA